MVRRIPLVLIVGIEKWLADNHVKQLLEKSALPFFNKRWVTLWKIEAGNGSKTLFF